MRSFLIRHVLPLFLVATASADWVIESTVESPKVHGVMVVKVKGEKVRMDIPNERLGALTSIVDTKTGDTLQIIHARKVAIKMDGAALKGMIKAARDKNGIKEGDSPELKATGETEKVGDYDCDIYTWSNDTVTKKYWVARNHPDAAALKEWEKQMRNDLLAGIQVGPDTTKLPGPVIRTESVTATGTMRSQITSIKQQEVDAKEFEVPEGYQSVAAPTSPAATPAAK